MHTYPQMLTRLQGVMFCGQYALWSICFGRYTLVNIDDPAGCPVGAFGFSSAMNLRELR